MCGEGHLRSVPRSVNAVLGLLLLVLSGSGGCAGYREYQQGMTCLRAGDYDAAVEKLKEAVLLAPQNRAYLGALDDAKKKGAQWHLERAPECVGVTDLGLAEGHLKKALEYCPEIQGAARMLKQVRALIAEAGQLRQKALGLSKHDRWDEAVVCMRAALRKYRSMPGGKQALKDLKLGASNWHVKVARGFLDKDDWDRTEGHAKQALDYVPGNKAAEGLLKEVANRRKAQELVREADSLFSSGRLREALVVFERAHELHRQRADIVKKIRKTKEGICRQLISKADALSRAGDFAGALRNLRRSEALLPAFGGVDKLIRAACGSLAERHMGSARKALGAGQDGRALVHFLAALGYDGSNVQAKEKLVKQVQVLRDRTKYVIGVPRFQASMGCEDIAPNFGLAVVRQLLRVKPLNVSVVEWTDLEKLLAKAGLGWPDLVIPELRGRCRKLKGVDGLLMGKIRSCRVLKDRTTTWATTKYQDGVKMVPNPDYAAAEERVAAAEREVASIRNQLASMSLLRLLGGLAPGKLGEVLRDGGLLGGLAGRARLTAAMQTLAAAQRQLASTPREIAKPNIVQYRYPVHTVTATATLEASLELLDLMTGRVVLERGVSGRYCESDRYVRADPRRNVTGDPLELPGQDSMRRRAIEKALRALDAAVEEAARKHGQRFVIMAERAVARKDRAGAVQHALCYLLAYPTGGESRAAMLKIVCADLAAERDLLALPELLREHCGVLQAPGELPVRVSQVGHRLRVVRIRDAAAVSKVKTPCVLTAVAGYPVASLVQLRALLSSFGAGQAVPVTLTDSDGREVTVRLRLVPAKGSSDRPREPRGPDKGRSGPQERSTKAEPRVRL